MGLSCVSEVGGKSAAPQPGNRFVSFVRARGAGCEVEMQLKRHPRVFLFPFCPASCSLFPLGPRETPRSPQSSYPALDGFIGPFPVESLIHFYRSGPWAGSHGTRSHGSGPGFLGTKSHGLSPWTRSHGTRSMGPMGPRPWGLIWARKNFSESARLVGKSFPHPGESPTPDNTTISPIWDQDSKMDQQILD